jgi:hypothetical protein
MPGSILPTSSAIPPIKLSHSDQARINGAKSKGPTTPIGKQRSSANALKHGLTAKEHVVLDVEDSAEYDAVSNAAIQEFRPHSAFALRLVEKLAQLDWRIERLAMLETAYLNYKVNQADGLVFPETDPLAEAAEGNDELAALVSAWKASVGNSSALDLLRRYSSTLEQQFNKTFAHIRALETRNSTATSNGNDPDTALAPPYQKPSYPNAVPPIASASIEDANAVPLAAANTPGCETNPGSAKSLERVDTSIPIRESPMDKRMTNG